MPLINKNIRISNFSDMSTTHLKNPDNQNENQIYEFLFKFVLYKSNNFENCIGNIRVPIEF